MMTSHGKKYGAIATSLLLGLLLSMSSMASFGAAPLAVAAEDACCCCCACDASSATHGESEAREAGCACGPAPAHPQPDPASAAIPERAPTGQGFQALLSQAANALPYLEFLPLHDGTSSRDLQDATPVSTHSRINC